MCVAHYTSATPAVSLQPCLLFAEIRPGDVEEKKGKEKQDKTQLYHALIGPKNVAVGLCSDVAITQRA